MADAHLTAARLRELLSYDERTGVFVRLQRTAQRHRVGDRADVPIRTGPLIGYRRVSLDSARFMAHRLAWLYVHEEWPGASVDHIDGDRSNNAIANLRVAPASLNQENKKGPQRNNRCGFLGVIQHGERWRARITVKRRGIHIGLYATAEEAHAAYLEAKRRLHAGCTI